MSDLSCPPTDLESQSTTVLRLQYFHTLPLSLLLLVNVPIHLLGFLKLSNPLVAVVPFLIFSPWVRRALSESEQTAESSSVY